MTWLKSPVMAFDLETTGVDVETARIVSAACVVVSPDGATGHRTQWLINPGVPIPAEATAVHGIIDEQVAEHGTEPIPTLSVIVGTLMSAIKRGVPIATMNGVYDLTLLDRDCRRNGVATLTERTPFEFGPAGPGLRPVIDVRVLDKQADKYRKGGRRLTDLCALYGVELPRAHDATADAVAAAQVAFAIGNRYPWMGNMSAGKLHDSQVGWHAQQVSSFAAYRRRVGNPLEDDSIDWPVR